MSIKWETDKERKIFYARQGNITVGYVIVRDDGSISWSIEAVSTKFIAKGYGDSPSIEAAKKAVSRSWNIWLDKANLIPRI